MRRKTQQAVIAAVVTAALASEAAAALSYYVTTDGWPDEARRTAAVNAIQSATSRYNAYGDFGNYSIYIYYNAGIPTAQASYLGSIGFGGTYPNERVMMHELAHYLGSGTYGDPWDGSRGEALVDQFDGLEAALQGDANHFWPYGLNYDSEGSEINRQRQVAMIYAQRADMGIGSAANPWSATVVNLIASDVLGESGFNYAGTWSDGRFAHPGAAYSTGDFLLRTPAGNNSFTFVGESLKVNNTNGISGGLLYKGTGTRGLLTFTNLILSGGYVRHASGAGDLFQLAGNVTLAGASTIDAAQGNIRMLATIGGSGSLTKTGSGTLTLTGSNTCTGNTTVQSGVFLVNGSVAGGVTVQNSGTLGGTGSIAGSLVVQAGGTVSPGSGIESLDVAGNAGIAGLFKVEYNSASIDLLNVGGQLDISAATVDFHALGSPNSTSPCVFATYNSLAGTAFAGVVNLPPTHWIDYHHNGNSVALVSYVRADLDRDTDVDSHDHAIFENCTTGPGLPYNPAALPPGCTLTPDGNGHIGADFNGDDDVDQGDFGILQRCYSGAGNLADASCAQ